MQTLYALLHCCFISAGELTCDQFFILIYIVLVYIKKLFCFLNCRTDENDLDDLSCTNIGQQQGKLKTSHHKEYEA